MITSLHAQPLPESVADSLQYVQRASFKREGIWKPVIERALKGPILISANGSGLDAKTLADRAASAASAYFPKQLSVRALADGTGVVIRKRAD